MQSSRERLVHLLALAEQGPALRAALAEEIVALLLDWPDDCPKSMRAPCEALLEHVAMDADPAMLSRLSRDIIDAEGLPLCFLNALFFSAPDDLKREILARNESSAQMPEAADSVDQIALVGAARKNTGFEGEFARLLNLLPAMAGEILCDRSGHSLAVACKGAQVSRAAYSAITLLASVDSQSVTRLDAYDTVPADAAANMLQYWRQRATPIRAAAE